MSGLPGMGSPSVVLNVKARIGIGKGSGFQKANKHHIREGTMKEYSRRQQFISTVEKGMGDNRYIINEREKGQKRKFTCKCCGKTHDFSNSIDYVGAVDQWERGGGKCYACANGFCHCHEGGWPKNSK